MITAVRALRTYVVAFLETGLWFGLAMAVVGVVVDGDDVSEALRYGLRAGLFFGLAMAAVLGTVEVVAHRHTPRGAPWGPRQEVKVPVVDDGRLLDRAVAALRALPAEVTTVDVPAGRVVARRGMSGMSWGEEVTVALSDPAAPVATISSRPRLRLTAFDAGRGRRNVDQVARALTGRR